MMYDLPTSVEVCGKRYAIRSDYRAILDICTALYDEELSENERAFTALHIFYPEIDGMPEEDYREALNQCFLFIDCGSREQRRPSPRLMDWEQDFQYIVAPVNRVIGKEIRAEEYLHWWTFVSAYYEIGDCTFAQIVRIRDRLQRGKPLDKQDREWYNKNRQIVDLKNKYTSAEEELLKQWIK